MNSVETSLYYLVTRFYDPEIGRFVSADDISYLNPKSIGGLNLFAYCLNNPIMMVDPDGHLAFLILLGISVTSSLLFELGSDVLDDGKINSNWRNYAGALAAGVIGSLGGGVFSTLILGVAAGYADAWINGTLTAENAFMIGVTSLAATGIGIGIGFAARKIASNIKANSFIKMKGTIDNNTINRALKPIANGWNIGAKKSTATFLSNQIFSANKWNAGQLTYELTSSFVQELLGLI